MMTERGKITIVAFVVRRFVMRRLFGPFLFLIFLSISIEGRTASFFDQSDEVAFLKRCNSFVWTHSPTFAQLKAHGAFEEGWEKKEFGMETKKLAEGLVESLKFEYGTFEYSPPQQERELLAGYRAFLENYGKQDNPSEEMNAYVIVFMSLFNLVSS